MSIDKVLGKENKILIVDDDSSVRNFLQNFLNMKGYKNILIVDNGEEAIEIINNDDIKLVLLDIMLPGMNGLDILRKIREINDDIGVIMITGYPEEEMAKKLLKEGAYDYIVKPFDLSYLESSVFSRIIMM